jgi:ubiquinol-cytochrome c reductase cytochrome c subunit
VRSRDAWLVVATAAGCLVVVGSIALRPAPGATAIAATTPDRPADVRHIWLRDCAQCHGANGGGTQYGPNIRHSGSALIDFELTTGRMPVPYVHASEPQKPSRNEQQPRREPAYDPATIRALVAYVTDLTGRGGAPIPDIDPASGDLAAGGTLFRLQCAACHAWSGDGGALLDREAPSTHPATSLQIAEAVRGGPGNMPRFGAAALTNRQLDSLVRYVRYLDHADDRGGSPLWHLGPFAEGAVAIIIGLGVLVLATRWIGTRT